VGDVLLDVAQDASDREEAERLLEEAEVMVDALIERAMPGEDGGLFWRFVEHLRTYLCCRRAPRGCKVRPGSQPSSCAWRVTERGLGAVVVDRPDQWWAVPKHVRLSTRTSGPFC
jgi:hypothetical protein